VVAITKLLPLWRHREAREGNSSSDKSLMRAYQHSTLVRQLIESGKRYLTFTNGGNRPRFAAAAVALDAIAR